MRKAAQAWEDHYVGKLAEAGYVQGRAAPSCFFNKETGGRLVVHGDDFTFLAVEVELERMRRLMAEWYEIKFRGVLGGG